MLTRVCSGFSLVAVLIAVSGCATTFEGDAHVPDGASGCQNLCRAQGLEMVGMVLMGEYSDGCICKVRNAGAATMTDEQIAVAGAGPAAVGVVTAMRAQQQQHRAAGMH
jgi:hypothetical protein